MIVGSSLLNTHNSSSYIEWYDLCYLKSTNEQISIFFLQHLHDQGDLIIDMVQKDIIGSLVLGLVCIASLVIDLLFAQS